MTKKRIVIRALSPPARVQLSALETNYHALPALGPAPEALIPPLPVQLIPGHIHHNISPSTTTRNPRWALTLIIVTQQIERKKPGG